MTPVSATHPYWTRQTIFFAIALVLFVIALLSTPWVHPFNVAHFETWLAGGFIAFTVAHLP